MASIQTWLNSNTTRTGWELDKLKVDSISVNLGESRLCSFTVWFFPNSVFTPRGFFWVGVKAGVRSGCSRNVLWCISTVQAQSLHRGVLKLWVCYISMIDSPTTGSEGGPCMILCSSWTEDLVEALVRSSIQGPCKRRMQISCLSGACMKAIVGGSWEPFVSRPCKVPSSSSRSFYDNLLLKVV